MLRICCGLLLVALTTLMVELTLIRVFDVIWYPNMAYMIITLAMFSFGLSGVYSTLRPVKQGTNINFYIAVLSVLFGLFALAILPVMNGVPFVRLLYSNPDKGLFTFFLMYLTLGIPFFLSGLIFTTVFSTYAGKIRTLYFWDLAGAALGCVIIVPFLPQIGPGGLLLVGCAFTLWASGLFSENGKWASVSAITGVVLVLVPFLATSLNFDFEDQLYKRGVRDARKKGLVELSHWDPISKIDVVKQRHRRHIAYDGGTQSTFIFPFDGDFKALRKKLPVKPMFHFTGQNVLTAHFLKRDSGQNVLIIGSAGGQEIKAALTWGAARVDAVELVDFVVRLGKETYAEYNGTPMEPKNSIVSF